MPIVQRDAVIAHVLIGINGNLETGSAEVTYKRLENGSEVRRDIVIHLPPDQMVALLSAPITEQEVGMPPGAFLAKRIDAWVASSGQLLGVAE